MTSEAIEVVYRLSWSQRPLKWLLKATCTWIMGHETLLLCRYTTSLFSVILLVQPPTPNRHWALAFLDPINLFRRFVELVDYSNVFQRNPIGGPLTPWKIDDLGGQVDSTTSKNTSTFKIHVNARKISNTCCHRNQMPTRKTSCRRPRPRPRPCHSIR